ncbi:hypothetical protein MKW94_001506 [Papaver nudicaule]|uniref:LOB domain-containing protein n=1 Tax=Papaver nudicaule TaxID=74823 RepID=A0AA42B0J3_PAPNU|nr:hypothetical protein [Papaver nudicaule]
MNNTRCAACKHLRRKCPSDCIFYPYFPSNNPQRFAYVHKIFGASNISKMLKQLPEHKRAEAADSLYMEAKFRVQDPVYGCVGVISSLQQQIQTTQSQLAETQAHMTFINAHQPNADQHQLQQQPCYPQTFSSLRSEEIRVEDTTHSFLNNNLLQESPQLPDNR